MLDEKSCFIIMPLTTPEPMREAYRDGQYHFRHVLQCLFEPGVQKAGYKPIPPIAKGSDLIHAEIINNLESADLVLCDMSALNPNVFFEYGIRTSLNKPVCVVKDELTKKVPFDTAILNYQQYKSTLEPWELNAEIDKLAAHVKASPERSKGENTLWRYFGLKAEAAPYQAETGTDAKLDYLTMQMDGLRQKIDAIEHTRIPETDATLAIKAMANQYFGYIQSRLPPGTNVRDVSPIGPYTIVVTHTGPIPSDLQEYIRADVSRQSNRDVVFRRLDTDSQEQNGEK